MKWLNPRPAPAPPRVQESGSASQSIHVFSTRHNFSRTRNAVKSENPHDKPARCPMCRRVMELSVAMAVYIKQTFQTRRSKRLAERYVPTPTRMYQQENLSELSYTPRSGLERWTGEPLPGQHHIRPRSRGPTPPLQGWPNPLLRRRPTPPLRGGAAHPLQVRPTPPLHRRPTPTPPSPSPQPSLRSIAPIPPRKDTPPIPAKSPLRGEIRLPSLVELDGAKLYYGGWPSGPREHFEIVREPVREPVGWVTPPTVAGPSDEDRWTRVRRREREGEEYDGMMFSHT